jgi:hypothetical protein
MMDKSYYDVKRLSDGTVVCIHVLIDEAGKEKREMIKHVDRHSPDGFEFGYGGSGPSDLALSILSDFAKTKYFRDNQDEAEKIEDYYQNFKWHFIAGMSEPGGQITHDEILSWMIQGAPLLPEKLRKSLHHVW